MARRLVGASLLLLAAACAGTPRAADRASAPASPRPAPDLSIPERMAVLAIEGRPASTDRWDVWTGTLWPAGVRAVGLLQRSAGRFEHVLPARGAAVSSRGAVLTFEEHPRLYLRASAAPITIASPLDEASFSPDGAVILGITRGEWVLVDASDGKVLRRREATVSPSTRIAAWRNETAILGEDGDYQVLRLSDLETLIAHASGPLAPTGDRLADCAEPTYDRDRPRDGVALRVLDTRTGAVLHEQRGDPPRYTRAGHRDIRWSPDGRRLSWVSNELHILHVDRRKDTRVPLIQIGGEGDADSSYLAIPTSDGSRVCFMQDGYDATYDVARRALSRSRPGWAVRCAIGDAAAHVVEVPLRAHEVIIDLPVEGFGVWPDAVFSADGARAAVLVTDRRIAREKARPLALLVVDVAKRRLVHRVELGTIAEGGWRPRLTGTDDGKAVDVEPSTGGPDQTTRRFDLQSGAEIRVPDGAQAPAPPADAAFAAARADVEIHGESVLWRGPERITAARLDRPAPAHIWSRAGCVFRLSPRGHMALRLCGERGERGSEGGELVSLSGGVLREIKPQHDVGAFAVADDGSTSFVTANRLHVTVNEQTRTVDPKPGGGAFTSVAWSPDGQHLAAWHAGEGAVYLLRRDGDVPRWKKTAVQRHGVHAVRFSDDGRRVVLDDGEEFAVEEASTAAPSPPVADEPAALLEPLDRDRSLPRARFAGGAIVGTMHRHGLVRLHQRATGAAIATMVPTKQGSAVAIFADGRVDWIGEPVMAPDIVCLHGTSAVPPERCAPLHDREALPRVLGTRAQAP